MLRTDSFVGACSAAEDAPKEWIADENHRRRVAGILAEAQETAQEQYTCYRE